MKLCADIRQFSAALLTHLRAAREIIGNINSDLSIAMGIVIVRVENFAEAMVAELG